MGETSVLEQGFDVREIFSTGSVHLLMLETILQYLCTYTLHVYLQNVPINAKVKQICSDSTGEPVVIQVPALRRVFRSSGRLGEGVDVEGGRRTSMEGFKTVDEGAVKEDERLDFACRGTLATQEEG